MTKKTTPGEFRKKLPELLRNMHIQLNSKTSQKTNIKNAEKNFWYFFRNYLAHYAHQKSPQFHKEIIKLLEEKHPYVAIAAPRGFSKSTLVSFAYVLWNAIFSKKHFILIISSTEDLATDLVQSILYEFQDNKLLKQDYWIKIKKVSQNDIIIGNTRILARGRQQSLRGFRYREHRPDLIILDDIEKDIEALSPMIVQKSLDTIQRGLIPSLTPNGQIVLIGTILRKNSVVGKILTSQDEIWKNWKRKIYQALYTKNGKLKSLWPERFPIDFLEKRKQSLGIGAFNAEYQNLPINDNALFQETHIIEGYNPNDAPMLMFIDPSTDGNKLQDFKACVLISRSIEGKYCIHDAILEQGHDDEFFLRTTQLFIKYRDRILNIGVETNGFQAYFMKELDRYATKQGLSLPLIGIKQNLPKTYRIARLLGYLETQKLVFSPEFKTSRVGAILIEQLLFYPSPNVHDDGIDALEACIDLFSRISSKNNEEFIYLPRVPKFRIT